MMQGTSFIVINKKKHSSPSQALIDIQVSLDTIVTRNTEGVEFMFVNGKGEQKVHFYQHVAMINLVKTDILLRAKNL